MARQVPQRSRPPYFLIIMVFLFLVSATLAVLQYMKADDAAKDVVKAEARLADMASSKELQDSEISAMVAAAGKTKRGKLRQSVVGQLRAQVKDLVRKIEGKDTPFGQAIQDADSVFAEGAEQHGLVAEVQLLNSRLADSKQQLSDKNTELSKRTDELAAAKLAMAALDRKIASDASALGAQLADIESKLNAEQAEHAAIRAKARDEADKAIEGLRQQIAKLNGEKAKFRGDLLVENGKLVAMTRDRDRWRDIAQGGKSTKTMLRVAGEIMDDPAADGAVYINIGKDAAVKPGWTFAVYPKGEISTDTKSKGAIRVVNVEAGISECHVTSSSKDAPIGEGDQIANVAYGKKRTYTFVVYGQFDLLQEGRPSAAGTEEVKTLIARYGGKLADDVGIKTDYVVLGANIQPLKPMADATPQTRRVYAERLKLYDRYKDIERKAVELRIPVLNTNRFMDRLGDRPIQTLVYE